MKSTVTSLNHVLAFQLEGMYENIKILQAALPTAIKNASEPFTKDLLRSYTEVLTDERLKLKRIFGYVLCGPYGRKSGAVSDAIAPFKEISELNSVCSLRDIILINSMQASVQFMITSYVDARYIAMRVELDNVVALLDEMLDAEESILQNLRCYSAQLVNDACLLAPVN